ncbi:MAG: T9SS type A sorting domain-containing protein [Bacteroidota bacterium]
MKRSSSLWLLLLLVPLGVQAQDYSDLDPSRWFPLELGNYWYYEYEQPPEFVQEVRTIDRDTLIDGRRWAALTTTYCNVEFRTSCAVGLRSWYSFTEDFYLLRAAVGLGPDRILENVDTVYASSPVSAFNATLPRDTLSLWWRPNEPLMVDLRENAQGSAADTTQLELFMYPLFFGGFARYVYNIGPSSALVGALINGREWGDVSDLRRLIALPNEPPESLPEARLAVYPNPARGRFTVALTLPSAEHVSFEVVNVLGQTVARYGPIWSMGGTTHHPWLIPPSLAAGAYVLHVRLADRVFLTHPLVLV